MMKAIVIMAVTVMSQAAFAATPASCVDNNGKSLPASKCVSTAKVVATEEPTVAGFPNRKRMILKDLRHGEGVLKKLISCAEKSSTDESLNACARARTPG